MNVNIVDDQVHLIVATKIVITINVRLIVQPYQTGEVLSGRSDQVDTLSVSPALFGASQTSGT